MKKKTLILDLDGTLYFQYGVQILMGLWMLSYYLFHFWRFKEFKAIMNYRKNREKEIDDIVDKQFDIVAQKYNMSVEYVKELIDKWMFQKPLSILPIFKDKKLARIIDDFKKINGNIIIYSDYPTVDKLKALEINYDATYDSTNSKIRVLKPDPKGLNAIIKENKLKKEEILYIGDRDSKDGACARSSNVNYVILPKLLRRKKYLKIRKMIGVI